MMQVLKRWVVRVTFADAAKAPVQFYIHDHFLGNVQRKVADLSFSRGLEPDPWKVEIFADDVVTPESGAYATTADGGPR